MTPKTKKGNRAWAKTYAELGWKVLPLHSPRDGKCSCGRPLDHKGAAKHPHTRNGVKDATTDLAKIDAWFDRWPDANVGVACGAESGIDTIDIDVQKGADLNGLGELPPGPVFKTGGGGLQRLYLHQNGQGPSVGKLAELSSLLRAGRVRDRAVRYGSRRTPPAGPLRRAQAGRVPATLPGVLAGMVSRVRQGCSYKGLQRMSTRPRA